MKLHVQLDCDDDIETKKIGLIEEQGSALISLILSIFVLMDLTSSDRISQSEIEADSQQAETKMMSTLAANFRSLPNATRAKVEQSEVEGRFSGLTRCFTQ